MNVEIQTYWNVETLYYVFNAVAALMTSSGFEGLIKMVFFFAIGIAIFAYAGNKQLELAKWFIQALIFVTILNFPIARVSLTDKTGLEPPRAVDNVPFALAVIAQATNLTFGFLTNAYETVFGVPEELGLQKGDVGFGHRILKSVNNATISSPQLRADLMQFIKECTIYDIKDGVIESREIVSGTDTWNTMFSNTSPARFVTYDTLTPSPQTVPCTDAAAILKDRVAEAVEAAQKFYGKQAFSRATSDDIAESMFISAVGTSYEWILNNSSNASTALRQSMFNNIWKDAGTELPALLNDPARVGEVNAMMSSAQAARQAAGANDSISILAQETLPHMRNWIEAIIYAMFPIVVILMVVMTAQGAKQILGGYVMALAWVGMWPVLFAVINHLSMMHMRYKLRALDLAASAGVPFQLSDVFDATLTNEQSLIGYMVLLVPFISAGIVKMGQGGIMSLADRMTAGFSSAVHGAGYQTAIGNHSSGQVGLDSASVNTTTMHRYDSNIGLMGGGATIGMGNGDITTMSPNGAQAIRQFRSDFLHGLKTEQRFDSSLSQEGYQSQIVSHGNQIINSHSDGANLNSVASSERNRGSSQQIGRMTSESVQGMHSVHAGDQWNFNEVNQMGSNFNKDSRASAHFNLGLGLGGGGGGGGGGRGGGGGGGGGRGGWRLPFSGGLNGGRTYSAGQNWNYYNLTGVNEQTNTGEEYRTQNMGSFQNSQGEGEQSGQNKRVADEAARLSSYQVTQNNDLTRRKDSGMNNRSGRTETNQFTESRDLGNDTDFAARVAAQNGMSAARFFAQPRAAQLEMMYQAAAEMEMVQKAKRLQKTGLDGQPVPTTDADLAGQYAKARTQMKSSTSVDDINKKYREGIGVNNDSVAPLQPKSLSPAFVESANDQIAKLRGKVQDNSKPVLDQVKKHTNGQVSENDTIEEMAFRNLAQAVKNRANKPLRMATEVIKEVGKVVNMTNSNQNDKQ